MKAPQIKKTGKKLKQTLKTKGGSDLFPRIQDIIARQLKKKPAEITLASVLQTDLSADSLDALEIIFQLEEEFHIKIDEADARKMVSVRDIFDYIGLKTKN